MKEEEIPATEAQEEAAGDERSHYECAFHILPTVAEEEVPAVFGEIKTLIDGEGGEVVLEEAPQRAELAYELVRSVEGKRQRYNQSYFGWVRFLLPKDRVAHFKAELDLEPRILRFLLISLTRKEVANPFRMYERERQIAVDETDSASSEDGEKGEVSDEEIDKSLEEITA